MIKHFCDRCKKETKIAFEVKIDNSYSLFDYTKVELCDSCRNQIMKYIHNRKSEVEKDV